MAMNSESPKHGGDGNLEKRVTDVETRLTVIEKTMVTAEVFQRELGAFCDEMRIALDRLRADLSDQMRAGFDELRKEDGALRVEIAKVPFEVFKWLLVAAGLAAAIATAIYNIWFR